ncbi:MAG: riboflavin synthase, partial [Patescibacteria group bacterium]|nr:riboflavin synthase [Patescibacteria group bacterium]
SGHIVQGHVDGIAKLLSIVPSGNSRILKFSVSPTLTKFMVEKGPIAVNGVSLTLIEVSKNYFTVGIIPFTWENTMFHTLKISDYVNIETDILTKYMEKLSK